MGLGEGVFSLLIIGCVEVGAAALPRAGGDPARFRDAARPTAPRRLHADIRYPPTASAPDPPPRRSIVFLGACHLSRGTLQAAYVLPRVVLVPRRAFAARASRPF